MHVEAEKQAHVLVTGSEYSGCVVSDTLDEPVRLEEKERSPCDLRAQKSYAQCTVACERCKLPRTYRC